MPALGVLAILFVLWLISCINVLAEYERGVIFRLGKLLPQPKGPGLIFVFKPIDRMVRVSLRTVVLDVPQQDVITRDNVTVKVNAVVYFRVLEPIKAVVQVENYLYATSQEAQTTLRSILGQAHLDELLSERERLGAMLQEVINQHTDPWGVKESQVAVKAVDLPQEMQRAMAKQAESEREKRAKIIHALGERLCVPASMIAGYPGGTKLPDCLLAHTTHLAHLAEMVVTNADPGSGYADELRAALPNLRLEKDLALASNRDEVGLTRSPGTPANPGER